MKKGNICFATSFWARLRGLFKTEPYGSMLVIAPCSSIHTFGMKEPIHVAFFDQHGKVTLSCESVEPGRRIRSRCAVGVLEQYSAYADEWPKEGSYLSFVQED